MSPPTYRKIVTRELTTDFRKATEIVELPIPEEVKEGHVLMKTKYIGINASDLNFAAGKYRPGVQPPFDCGFEGIGEIVKIGPGVEDFKVGDFVQGKSYGAFAEYRELATEFVTKIPFLTKHLLPLTVCGVTASISLDLVADMKTNENVLVTAAAGATGQFAVQLAKLAGNHVIGTCSSTEKVEYLKSIGCDRVINYREENVKDVLTKEYPNGIDLVFESVGGELFETCVDALAVKGRIVVIGMISGYQDGSAFSQKEAEPIGLRLLRKSASIRGFFLQNYFDVLPEHIMKLSGLIQKKKLNAGVDPTVFKGLEGVADALDYMYERKNIGKLIVELE